MHVLSDPRFIPWFLGTLMVFGMWWVVFFLFREFISDWLQEARARVDRYEAREMRKRLSQPTSKVPKP